MGIMPCRTCFESEQGVGSYMFKFGAYMFKFGEYMFNFGAYMFKFDPGLKSLSAGTFAVYHAWKGSEIYRDYNRRNQRRKLDAGP